MKNTLCSLFTMGLLTVATPLAAFTIADSQPTPSFQIAVTNPNYSQLQNFLTAKNWQAADAETRRILESFLDPNPSQYYYGVPNLEAIPVEVIRDLDRMWQNASGGRFGFRVQQQLWQNALKQHPRDINAAVKAFGDQVGWTRPATKPDETFIAPEWLTEPELTFNLNAPVGHFPWVGISWETITNMIREAGPGCGSCTIDAMNLQGDRFYRYTPLLYRRVETALVSSSSTSAQTWQNLKLRHQIDLQTLYPNIYPNNGCPIYTRAQAVSPNSELLAVSSYSYERACGGNPNNSTLALWNTQRGTRLITLVRGQATESFSHSGQAQEPPTESTRIVGDVVNAVMFTPDSRLVVAGLSNGTIRLWTTDTGKEVRTLSGHRYAVRSLDISADGKFLVSGSSDSTMRLWNLQTGQLLQTINLQPSSGIVHQVKISPNGKHLVSATDKNQLQLWEFSTGRLIRTFVDNSVGGNHLLPIQFSPNGELIAIADIDHSVKLWKTATGARLITLKGHTKEVQSLTFSPNGQALASSSHDNTVRLWNLQTYKPTQTLNVVQSTGHPATPSNLGYLAFSPNGQILATSALLLPPVQSEGIPQQGVRLWNLSTGQPLQDIYNVSRFNFSPNSQFFLTDGQTLRIWQP